MKTSKETLSVEPTRRLLHGVEAALKRPVLLDPRAVDAVLAATVFHRKFAQTTPDETTVDDRFSRVGNVAVVDIRGPLAQRAWDCMGMFGGDGYDAIVDRIKAALADPQTSGLLLRIDSPGGEVAGCFEAVREIRAMARASGKPMVAYADELAASAAYALACAADVIVLPDTGAVGSVGVITTVIDQSEALDREGIKVHVITSGDRKADGHPAMPMSDDTRAVIQAEIDHIAQVFAREVSNARGMTEEAVLALEAGVFLGQSAVDHGLADVLGNQRSALAIAAGAPWKQQSAVSAQSIHGEKTMKSLMIELGLAENASETEALKAVKALTARAERAEQGTQKLCSITGQADVGGAIGVAQAWKEDAARAQALDKEVAEMKAAKTSTDVDAALDKAVKELRVMPAEVPSLREQGLKDPGWLKGYLAVKTSVAQGAPFVQPAGNGSPQSRAKTWKDMTPQEKADLYHSDRATYEALKAAAKAA